jgi:hypothetical protein
MAGDEIFRARATTSKSSKLKVGVYYECTTSLPRGLRRLIGHGLDNLDDQAEGFIDFEQGLDWTFRMAKYEGKRQNAEGPTQAW